ncbi:type I DNA topoisomerase [Vibrio renipiscarius]|uniref:DNA topoisomerase n=1 Tax=Vibrio renipiscarius TaxID=1461322 RepID=A0A0C2P2L7_9VIBR|nr:topoisomerase DNA-binding C4 zinc finger domain-containing protein [Vibrio renipiscarius]KII78992.1 DNA topoisomerase [Vibrio renipiscarius]KII82600.1 DNA topoisomerase [Vibrio renipiscarius]
MSSKIDQQLFSAHEHALEHQVCPQCQAEQREGELQLRHGKHGPFLGCTLYPECDYIKPLHQNDGHIIKELGVPCPQCGHELVLRQGRYGMFIGCSAYPSCNHIESLDQEEESSSDTIGCPECSRGHLVERKTRFGKLFYACDNYPKCKFAVNQPPVKGRCELCGFPLLVEKKLASGTKVQCAERKCQHTQAQ